MVFSDLFFIFAFIPSFALLYILASLIDKKMKTSPDTPYNRTKNWVLVLFSLLFYAWGEPVYVFLMLFSVLVNFIAGRVIDRSDRHRKMALVIGLICNILILGVFKYLGFFGSILADLGINVALPTLALPIGISFYTFQSISYLIDVYRRESPAQKRYADLLLYISMFPQLIAGPIVRYDTVATEITDRHVTANDVADGAFRFLVGLGKKVIIANQLSEVADQFLVGGIGNLSTTGAWVGILAFTLQIYFDFSGYSDMAIGIGRCLGFHFKENFNHPYCCNSITDFWRRWHMSLGSFIYSAWRKPSPSGLEHLCGVVPYGYVARRKLELHHLGCVFRLHRSGGEIHNSSLEEPYVHSPAPPVQPHSCGHRMGNILLRGLLADDCVLPFVLRTWRDIHRLRITGSGDGQVLAVPLCPCALHAGAQVNSRHHRKNTQEPQHNAQRGNTRRSHGALAGGACA